MKLNVKFAIFSMAMALAACSSDKTRDGFLDENASAVDGAGTNDGYSYNNDGAQVTDLDMSGNGSGDISDAQGLYDDEEFTPGDQLMQSPEFSDPSSPLSKRVIYFEYDSSQIQQSFIAVLEAHAQYLMNHPNQRIVLEGHTDERGTGEYNIALGEQRAKSVFKVMQLVGVMGSQADVVSYGEEKPAVFAHDQQAYAKNRRVELVYK